MPRKDALGEQTNTMHIHQHRYEISFYMLRLSACWLPSRNAENRIDAEVMPSGLQKSARVLESPWKVSEIISVNYIVVFFVASTVLNNECL